MPNRLFQGIINQMRDATDRIINMGFLPENINEFYYNSVCPKDDSEEFVIEERLSG